MPPTIDTAIVTKKLTIKTIMFIFSNLATLVRYGYKYLVALFKVFSNVKKSMPYSDREDFLYFLERFLTINSG